LRSAFGYRNVRAAAGVSSRDDAVTRAIELGLLEAGGDTTVRQLSTNDR
jgi:hypothetical protein